MLSLLGAEQLVAVVELHDLVGDPDVDVAACSGQTHKSQRAEDPRVGSWLP